MLEEPLIFEIGDTETHRRRFRRRRRSAASRLGGLERNRADRPRRPLRAARRCATTPASAAQNYAIDLGLFPLGSCTMKHNPRLNEKVARMPGFADIHPLQPVDTVQGALELIARARRMAGQADRHAQRRDEPQGGRAWRIVRPARDPLGARGARRRARGDPRPRKRARHQSRRPPPSPATGSRTSRRPPPAGSTSRR